MQTDPKDAPRPRDPRETNLLLHLILAIGALVALGAVGQAFMAYKLLTAPPSASVALQ